MCNVIFQGDLCTFDHGEDAIAIDSGKPPPNGSSAPIPPPNMPMPPPIPGMVVKYL